MRAFDRGAVCDYVRKRAIDGVVKCCLTPCSSKPPGDVQFVEFEDASFLRATPRQDVVRDGPGKNPAAVGAAKVSGSEWSTKSNNAINRVCWVQEINEVIVMGHYEDLLSFGVLQRKFFFL